MTQAFWNEFLQFAEMNKDKYSIVLSLLKTTEGRNIKEDTLDVVCTKGTTIYLNNRIKELEKMLQDFSGRPFTIKLVVEESKKTAPKQTPLLDFQPSTDDIVSKAGLNPKYRFDNFAVSSSNQVAYAASQAVAQSPGATYNPLFLYGGVGVGKTHLAHAVARAVIEKNSEKKVFYCPSDRFTNELIESMRAKSGPAFRKKFRSLSVLIIDDIQFIAGKDRVQEEFFHTFNDIISTGGQIILTSDRPPMQIKDLEDRLRSRFAGGLIVDINPPDFELRTAILLIKAQEKNIDIEIDAAKIIAQNIDDTRALEGTLLSIYAKIIGHKERIDTEVAENFFSQKSEKRATKLTPGDVIKTVCSYYNIKQSYIKSPTRVENIAFARQVVMYILHRKMGIKLVEVAFLIKRKDHTTIIHGCDKIERLIMKDESIKEEVDTIIKSLESST